MSDTMHNVRAYCSCEGHEYLGIITTSLFVAVLVNLRDLLFVHYGEWSLSVWNIGVTFAFLAIVIWAAVWACKLIGIRLGHVVHYRPHYAGLGVGAAITVMTAGYLPIFLPGGLSMEQPSRLRIGKWHGYHKGWEVGLVVGTFPLVMLVSVLLISPLYIMTGMTILVTLMAAACLTALFSLIPLTFFRRNARGRWLDLVRYMDGMTFGLELWCCSGAWYVVLCITVIVFSIATYALTAVGARVGILIYVLSLLLGLLGLWIYKLIFDKGSR